MSKFKAIIINTSHNYGIEIPTSSKHANDINRINKNGFWRDDISTEMTELGIAFGLLENRKVTPISWKKVTGHLVYDFKMGFTRKSRWVLGRHKTLNAIGSTYSQVVSRESVHIAFTYAILNGPDVFAADIRNAYLQPPSI